jgi:hypothetical protein
MMPVSSGGLGEATLRHRDIVWRARSRQRNVNVNRVHVTPAIYTPVGWAPRAHQMHPIPPDASDYGVTDGARFRQRNVNVDRVRVTPGSLYSFWRRKRSYPSVPDTATLIR